MSSFASLRAQREARHAHHRNGVLLSHAPSAGDTHSSADKAHEEGAASAKPPAATHGAELGGVAIAPPTTESVAATLQQPNAVVPLRIPDADNLFVAELEATPLEIRTTVEHGRGLYATRNVKTGTTLLRTKPITSVLSTAHLQTHCSTCHRATRVSRCASCKAAHYCSPACQKDDWPAHKHECAALSRLRKMWATTYPDKARRGENGFVPHEAVRALGRMCWARQASRDARWWTQVAGMESHASRGQAVEEGLRLAKQVQHLRHYLGAASGQGELLEPADMATFGFKGAGELLDMASAFAVNSFTLSTPDLTPIGVATSPLCALFNHSCEPNAVVVFPRAGERDGMVVVAISDIAEGEEVLTAYVDVSLPRAERQKDLRERYGFVCDCALCARRGADPRWSVLHPACAVGGVGEMPDLSPLGPHGEVPVTCTCGQKFEVDATKLRNQVEEGKGVLSDDENGRLDSASALATLSTLIPALSALVPPSSHPLLQLLRLNALLLTPPTPDQREHVLSFLTAAAEGATAAHPPNHPSVGVILAERAKIMAMGGDEGRVMLDARGIAAKRAEVLATVRALREAAGACERGFGGGDVADEMSRLAGECERELDMMRA